MTVVSSGTTSTGVEVTSGSMLEVASGGTVSSTLVDSGGYLQIDSGGTDVSATIAAGGSAYVLGSASNDQIYGVESVGVAGGTTSGTVSNEVVNSGGLLVLQATGDVANNTSVNALGSVYVTKSGTLNNLTITSGGTVTLNSTKALISGTVNLVGSGNTIVEDVSTISGASIYGDKATISGFSGNDVIDNPYLTYNSNTVYFTTSSTGSGFSATLYGGGNASTQTGGTAEAVYNFTSGTNIYLTSDTTVTSSGPGTEFVAVCFASGTLIRTTRGDVAVEHLAVGDIAITRDGRRKPIRWLGHRITRCDRHPNPRKVWPIRVVAGTFGYGLPSADLWLSPGHAICLDDCLVPVRGLVDGEHIVQVEQDEVTYWHVEVDGHDVLLSNGLPTESYLDTGNRRGFENAAEIVDLHFDEEPPQGYDRSGYCLPMVESGPRLAAIRARHGLGSCATPDVALTNEIYLAAGPSRVMPHLASANELRFLVPEGVADLCLISPSFPAGGADIRRLGIIINGLAVSDGSGWRQIGLDHPGLYAGFHDFERNDDGAWRWTNGEGHLSSVLWQGLSGEVLLRITGAFVSRGSTDRPEEPECAAA